MPDCLLAFGANEGDLKATYHAAVSAIEATEGVDSVIAGEAIATQSVGGPADQPDYLNASIRIATELSATALHERLIQIESQLGRERRERWGSRKIDLDLLLYGDHAIQTPTLTVPHPRMSFRKFVLQPSLEIAGDMIHVTSGKAIAQLLDHLDSRANVIAWVNPTEKILRELALDNSMAAWTLVPVHSVEQFAAFETQVKLVIVGKATEDDSESRELVHRALAFAGPTLDLTRAEDEDEVAEIQAAAAACS